MKKQEMERRIRELEAEVAVLKARPPVTITYPAPVCTRPHYPTYTPGIYPPYVQPYWHINTATTTRPAFIATN